MQDESLFAQIFELVVCAEAYAGIPVCDVIVIKQQLVKHQDKC